MDIQDTFPQRVWQIVADPGRILSRPTVMSPGCRFASGSASGRRSFKTPAGRQHLPCIGGEPPRRNITYRADLQRQRQALLAEGVVVSGK